jgi:WD40 repeat protein
MPAGPDFFVAGGTLPLQSQSYIERAADLQILASLESGRFCYVLNSRQMGKSSLCVRTMSRLTEKGIRCAFIDITKLGGRNVTPEQWYAGMALEIGRSTGLRKEILEYWKAEESVGPMQRFFGAIRQVLLGTTEDRFVIFVDEIDSTRSLPFNTDEFFAGVRECFNRRVQEQEFERLTFCFLGVAVPTDLMKDARTTPFNIGDRIYLRDFKLEEALPMAQHLGPEGKAVLERVHYWTNGHPFLTQSICRALMQHSAPSVKAVDEMIQRDLLEPKVRETNINLSDVGNRVLNGYADGDDVDEFRANILAAYQKARSGKEPLVDDESNRITAVLKLSGLMRSEGKQLIVRNRIYEHVFGKEWITENMPEQEVRRQRGAFTRGVVRTALISATIIGIIGFLAINNIGLRKKAEDTAREMSWRSYVSDMNRLPVLYDQNNTSLMERLLERHAKAEWRGPEWDIWNGRINDALWKAPIRRGRGREDFFPGQERLMWLEGNTALTIETKNGMVLEKFELPEPGPGPFAVMWDGKTIVRTNGPGKSYLIDIESRKVIKRCPPGMYLFPSRGFLSRDCRYALGTSAQADGVIDLSTMKFVLSWKIQNAAWYVGFMPDGKSVARAEQVGNLVTIRWYDIATQKVVREMRNMKNVWAGPMMGEDWITLTYSDGWLRRFRLSDSKLLWEIRLGDEKLAESTESADGSLVAASTDSRSGYLVRIENNVPRLVRRFSEAGSLTVSDDGKRIYASYQQVRAYDTSSLGKTIEKRLPNFLGGIAYLRGTDDLWASNSNLETLLKFKDGEFKTWHVSPDAKEVMTWRGADPMQPAAFQIDADKVRVFKIATNETIASFETIASVEFMLRTDRMLILDEKRLLFGNAQGEFDLIDFKTGTKKPGLRLKADLIRWTLSVQKELIAVGGDDGTLTLFDAKSLKTLWTAKEHFLMISNLVFSGDGTLLVTASIDDTAIVWDVKSGKMISRLEGHAQNVVAADFLPGNKRVVTASLDKTVRLWDVKTGAELTTVGLIGANPTFCSISKDQKYILAGNETGLLKAWSLAGGVSKSP